MNSFDILRIKTPERLFPNDAGEAKKLYRDLLKKWHPDACIDKDARKVSEHVIKLHDLAQRKISNGTWGYSGVFEIASPKDVSVPYLKSAPFELGRAFITERDYYLLYELAHLQLGRKFLGAARSFRYANPKMEQEVSRYLPVGASSPHKGLIRVPKVPGLLCLRDVLDYYGGCMIPPHVAWIMSSLYNLLCYFSYARFAHNDISPDTYFIDPEKHSGALLGGWFYATGLGEPLKQVPTRTYSFLPFKVRTTKRASRATDAALVAAVGRELLGDITGKDLSDSIVPKPMLDWLNAVHKSDAIENYRQWGKVLDASFGKRKFVEMSVRSEDLYPIND